MHNIIKQKLAKLHVDVRLMRANSSGSFPGNKRPFPAAKRTRFFSIVSTVDPAQDLEISYISLLQFAYIDPSGVHLSS